LTLTDSPHPKTLMDRKDAIALPHLETEWKPKTNPWVIALTVTLATFMEVLDTSIANVALPHIAGSLGATQNESTWILTSYLVANAIVLPAAAYVTTFIGRKKFYMICVGLFGFSSMLCGLAPTLPLLVFFRVLQGVGGGGLGPSEQAILADTFPPKQLGQAFALYGVAAVIAPAVGPLLGGWITDNFDWRWIFFINVPFTLLSLFLVNRLVEDPPHIKREVADAARSRLRPDIFGFGLLVSGFGSLELILDKGQEDDWFGSPVIVLCCAICAISLTTFLFWEVYQIRKGNRPILNLALFKRKTFSISCIFMFALGLTFYATLVLLPQYAQTLLGYTAALAGMVISPGGFALLFSMALVGALINKVDLRVLMCCGFLLIGASMILMHTFSLDSSFRYIMWVRIFQMCGPAFLFIPINTVSYIGVAKSENNDVSGIMNLVRNIGGSVGTALIGTMLARGSQRHQAYMVRNLTTGSPGLIAQIARLKPYLNGSVESAQNYIYKELQRQAAMLAYLDIIALMALLCIAIAPLAFFLNKPVPHSDAPVGH
jgi:DHA2 family multidrug resistance protein